MTNSDARPWYRTRINVRLCTTSQTFRELFEHNLVTNPCNVYQKRMEVVEFFIKTESLKINKGRRRIKGLTWSIAQQGKYNIETRVGGGWVDEGDGGPDNWDGRQGWNGRREESPFRPRFRRRKVPLSFFGVALTLGRRPPPFRVSPGRWVTGGSGTQGVVTLVRVPGYSIR